jgi:type II secretory pathway pseudopilin PulG
MRRTSAVTLFELLTVVAIVGTLVAIMAPVLAQSRIAAKKTANLARMKQTATSLLLYCGDNEDAFPLSGPVDPGLVTGTPGAFLFGWVAGFPNGWDGDQWEWSDSMAWPNATATYRFSDGVMHASDMPTVELRHYGGTSPYLHPRKTPKPASFTMNGLLHSWNASAVAMPSRLTLLWQGAYKAAISGYAYANPVLFCNAYTSAPCRFQPLGFPQEGASNSSFRGDAVYLPFGEDTAWIYGRGMNFVSVDSSARWRAQNPSGQTADTVRSYDDPAGLYGPNGKQRSFHRCVMGEGTMVRYTSFFRPDSEFHYEFGATQDTRCDPR